MQRRISLKILLVISSIAVPIIMLYLHKVNIRFQLVFNTIALIAAVLFGNISAISVYQVIIDNTVFMTAIHAIFLNPLFLITGAYLGGYIIYRLIIITLAER